MNRLCPRVTLDTEAGAIVIELDDVAAPETCRYVLGLVAGGLFDGATFYRSTNFGIEGRRPLIQGGPLAPVFTGSDAPRPPVEMLPVVESSGTTGLTHVRGTVSLARDLYSTGHVLPELFICLDDVPELDEHGRTEPDTLGFPAFATVAAGIEVVESIAAMETLGASPVDRLIGEVLTRPVPIVRATADQSSPESST